VGAAFVPARMCTSRGAAAALGGWGLGAGHAWRLGQRGRARLGRGAGVGQARGNVELGLGVLGWEKARAQVGQGGHGWATGKRWRGAPIGPQGRPARGRFWAELRPKEGIRMCFSFLITSYFLLSI
jgi:hypothetical protein